MCTFAQAHSYSSRWACLLFETNLQSTECVFSLCTLILMSSTRGNSQDSDHGDGFPRLLDLYAYPVSNPVRVTLGKLNENTDYETHAGKLTTAERQEVRPLSFM